MAEFHGRLARWTAAVLLGLLVMAALLVFARRIAGALEQPLPATSLVAAGCAMAAVAFSIHTGRRRAACRAQAAQRLELETAAPRTSEKVAESAASAGLGHSKPAGSGDGCDRGPSWPVDWQTSFATSFALLLLGAALNVAGTHPAASFTFWTVLVAEEAWAWSSAIRSGSGKISGQGCRTWRSDAPQIPLPHTSLAGVGASMPRPTQALDDPPHDDVDQQLTRSHTADADVLTGFVRIVFHPGQRTGAIHVAFCPPFNETPDLTVEQIDGPDARIKTAAILPYGVRLDLKLAAATDEPVCVLVQFEAREELRANSSIPQSDAALQPRTEDSGSR
jgi:hypothetical protein